MAEGTEGPHGDPDRADAGKPDDVHHPRGGRLPRHRTRPRLPRRQHQVQAPKVSFNQLQIVIQFRFRIKTLFKTSWIRFPKKKVWIRHMSLF